MTFFKEISEDASPSELMFGWLYKEYLRFQPVHLSNTVLGHTSKLNFLKTLFLLAIALWSRAKTTVEEKGPSHLILALLFSHPACVPHVNKMERRLNTPSSLLCP